MDQIVEKFKLPFHRQAEGCQVQKIQICSQGQSPGEKKVNRSLPGLFCNLLLLHQNSFKILQKQLFTEL